MPSTRLAVGLVLILVGLLLFGWGMLKIPGHQVWESNFELNSNVRSPIIQLQPGSRSRVGIFLRVESVDPNPRQRGVTYAFPLSYTVLDRQGKVILTEKTAVSSESEKISISKTNGLESGTSLFEIFFAPEDGRVSLTYRLSSTDNLKSTTASEASVRLYDLVTPTAEMLPLILVSIGLLLAGILLCVTNFW
ncbi:hypothetical protein [Chamaesiphon sp. VAR_48_metabat_403]|uniref:hypothetical protein n=1 Tax=Chamaesiphon sp. VAR_48_metabat_403 TaxID=2964700 RepID=UPI00286D8E3B|nr:hypothetical protein [Chamaesiphon sp. VAR_48_metabat_403]